LFSSILQLLLCQWQNSITTFDVTDTAVDCASVPLSSVFALPQLNIPIKGKIKIILMFSFYVFLFDLNFLQSIIPMLTKCYVSIMQYVFLLDGFLDTNFYLKTYKPIVICTSAIVLYGIVRKLCL
jgi:hypothetical protein